jgi:hypothetical protein
MSDVLSRIADLHAQLATTYREMAEARPAQQPDRVVGLTEAAARLNMTRAWLSRRSNWERVGGYLDADRRIKFTVSSLDAYIRSAAAK